MFKSCQKPKLDYASDDDIVKSRNQPVVIAGKGGGEEHATLGGTGYKYDGFAVICIDFLWDADDAKKITFSEATKSGDKNDNENKKTLRDEAIFIHNIQYIAGDDKHGKRVYKADKLTVKEAAEKFTEKYGEEAKAFFYIHGNITEAGYVFSSTAKAQPRFAKNKIVPVIWPSELGNTSYFNNKDTYLPIAVTELNQLLETVETENVFKGKSLICHSLGNYLLRKLATGGGNTNIKFDQIFMVAADVRHNLFDTDYITRNNGSRDGLNIFKMLNKGGKIHVLTNWDDGPLEISTNLGGNWLNRLGQAGMGTYDWWWYGWKDDRNLVHPEIRDHYLNLDAGKILQKKGPEGDADKHDKDDHGYTWYIFAINYYKRFIE